jgi:hypothetical protein
MAISIQPMTQSVGSSMTEINPKSKSLNEYQTYLANQYPCLTPGKNASVSIETEMLRKAANDPAAAKELEERLSTIPDLVRKAGESTKALGATLQSYQLIVGDGYMESRSIVRSEVGKPGLSEDIEKWLERIKAKRDKRKEDAKLLLDRNEAKLNFDSYV